LPEGLLRRSADLGRETVILSTKRFPNPPAVVV
jgi:hypothetical protein